MLPGNVEGTQYMLVDSPSEWIHEKLHLSIYSNTYHGKSFLICINLHYLGTLIHNLGLVHRYAIPSSYTTPLTIPLGNIFSLVKIQFNYHIVRGVHYHVKWMEYIENHTNLGSNAGSRSYHRRVSHECFFNSWFIQW